MPPTATSLHGYREWLAILSIVRRAFAAIWQRPSVKVSVALLAAIALLAFLNLTRDVWIILLLALLAAHLAQPLMNWTETRLRARWLGLVLFLLGLFLFLGLLSLMLASFVQQAARFSSELPALIDSLVRASQTLPANLRALPLPQVLLDVIDQAYQSLGALLKSLTDSLVSGVEGFVTQGGLLGGLTGLAGDAVRFFAFLAMTIYLVMDLPRVGRSLVRAAPVPYQNVVEELATDLGRSVGNYLRGQLVIAIVVGGMIGGGLALLGVPLAASLGFLAGVFNIVPYLGVIVGIVPSMLLAAGQGWFQVAGVVVVFTAANQLESHLLSPLILGRTTRLHPVTVIIAVLIGLHLFGIWGGVFAVPLASFLKAIYDRYYLNSGFYRDGN